MIECRRDIKEKGRQPTILVARTSFLVVISEIPETPIQKMS